MKITFNRFTVAHPSARLIPLVICALSLGAVVAGCGTKNSDDANGASSNAAPNPAVKSSPPPGVDVGALTAEQQAKQRAAQQAAQYFQGKK